MASDVVLQGRRLSDGQLQQVQDLVGTHADWSRYRLSRELCRLWNWSAPNGQLQDMAARSLLLKLEARGYVVLPPKRRASPNRMRHKKVAPVEHPTEPIRGSLAQLRPLDVRELSEHPEDVPLFEWLLHQYHYLSYVSPVGLNLKYLVRDGQGRPLSCLLFGSAAWKCAVRDAFIGWSAAQRQAHLQQLTNNTRFLLMPWAEVRHLATHVLGLVMRRLPFDWQRKYARPLALVETFVDLSRYTGACYRAANWRALGQTTGRSRQDRFGQLQVPPKGVWVYPLTRHFRRQLCA